MDFCLTNKGARVAVVPCTEQALAWAEDNLLEEDGYERYHQGIPLILVPIREIHGLTITIRNAGLTIKAGGLQDEHQLEYR